MGRPPLDEDSTAETRIFSVDIAVSARPKPRTISLSRIDPPLQDKGQDKGKSKNITVPYVNGIALTGEKDGKGTDPAAAIEAWEDGETYMVVFPGKGDRFVVSPAHRAMYAAYIALNQTNAQCNVCKPGTRLTIARPREERRVIVRVCPASVELCELLEGKAREHEPVSGASEEPSASEVVTTDKPKLYPRRAAWFKFQIKQRAVTKNRLEYVGGPARKTMTRIEKGLPVAENTLEKLAVALSHEGESVTFQDIPQD